VSRSGAAGTFTCLGCERLPAGASPGTGYHRDLAPFQDTGGKACVISVHGQHPPHGGIAPTACLPLQRVRRLSTSGAVSDELPRLQRGPGRLERR